MQTVTLACPSIGAAQVFFTLESELRTSGSDILFSDRERPEIGGMTGRTGKRWVELVSTADGELVSYALTVVASADEVTAAKPEPSPVPVATAMAEPTPEPLIAPERAAATVIPPATLPSPVSMPATMASVPYHPGFIFPKPILQVPIKPTADLVNSVRRHVVINMLVDISEDGIVTNAMLTGRITNDVLKLESAAFDAVSHWRFAPARQDERIVAARQNPRADAFSRMAVAS